MNSTEKLFYQDTHIVDFTGTVLECTALENGSFQVLLDRTAFFPEEGGQAADAGTLDGQEVLDVQIHKDQIFHMVKKPLAVGSKVTGHVDWDRRFDFMQQHSGEHMISGLVHKHFGYDNVGFHLGLTEVTMDFNGTLSLAQLREIELEANHAVWADLPVEVTFPAPDVLKAMEYRSKLELTENVRIVTIPGIDICACCAPHVERTGQIGLIKITGVQSHRGGVRVNILCGKRALQDFSLRQDSVSDISVQLSAKPERIAEAVAQLKEENAKQRLRANLLQEKLLKLQTAALPAPEEQPDVCLFLEDLDPIAVRNTVNELAGRYPGYCALFVGNETDGYRFVIGSSAKDCRELAKGLRETFQAKGGGSAPMIQGSVTASKKALQQYFLALG